VIVRGVVAAQTHHTDDRVDAAAQTRATRTELTGRLDHSTPQAALPNQHAAPGRDAEIAAALSRLADGAT
jgi:hypothetical protein